MSEPLLLRTETGGVLEIVLNRPAKLNAINREMWEGIRDAIEDFRVSPRTACHAVSGEREIFLRGLGFDRL